MTDASLIVSECQVQFDEGYLRAALDLSPTLSKIHVKTEHFPIDLFALGTSRFSLQGNSSLEISLEGSETNLQGRINILLEEGKLLQAGKKTPIQTKGSLQANLDKGIVQIHGELIASNEQYFELTGTLPIAYQVYPLKIGLEKNKTISGELTIDGHLEELFDFVNIGSHRITGLLSGRLLLSRTLSSPSLLGSFEVQNGSYENYFTGMMYNDIQVKGSSEGSVIRFTSIEGKDEDRGTVQGTGKLSLEEKFPFSFDGTATDIKILQLDWLSGSITGPVNISGNTDAALAKGSVKVSRADFHIPDELPIDLPILPVTYINEPEYLHEAMIQPEPPYPFHYDAELTADGNIFLSGRGLNSELEGKVHVVGKNLSCDVNGSLRLIKGKFSFSGKDFTLTNGEIAFSPTAYLNITGTLSLPNLTVTAMLRGPLTSPQLTFQSNPSMPTSSILAQILFNKDISELTAAQALQLADTIVTLSGGAGPSVLETIRKSLGIDRLNIVSSGDSDQVSVQIGKYLTEGVMVTLAQSADSSQIIVEVQLKGGFILQAETQEDEQGKFSFKWNKNY
jgi:translocation and assembly module TamB